MKRVLMAVDPGKAGGLAWRDQDGRTVADAMPETPGAVLEYVREIIRAADGAENVSALVEKVGGYAGGTGQPGSAMFRFGEGYGFLLGVLMACGVRVELVTPQTWQKAVGLGHRGRDQSKADWKRKLRAQAERLFPGVKVTLANADALLLLEYGRRRNMGN